MRRLGWAWGVVIGLGLGCHQAGQEKFTPAEGTAREALEAALTRWRDGQPQPAQFPLGKVKVEVVNQAWTDGQKLQGFEVLGEEPGGSGPRVFSVKLKTPKGEQTTRYYVVGIDPLWVYAEPDYKKLTGT